MRDRNELLKRISIDPRLCFGRPVIRGTRIWVSLVVDNLAEGIPEAELVAAYPQLRAVCVGLGGPSPDQRSSTGAGRTALFQFPSATASRSSRSVNRWSWKARRIPWLSIRIAPGSSIRF